MDLDRERVASATECTGLMPALPQNPVQGAVAAKLYGIHPARRKRRAKKK